MSSKTAYFIFLFCCLIAVDCLKTGAPASVCETMTPVHGSGPQKTNAPYSLSASPNGENGRFLISLEGSQDFAGFLVQARVNPDRTQIIGSFVDIPDGIKALCGPTNSGAVTHKDNAKKKKIEVEWEAPANFEGEVTFVASVVYDYATFWTGILSQPLQIKQRSVATNVAGSISTMEFNLYNGCGSTKMCLGSPENCVTSKNCRAAVTVSINGDTFEFEMMAKDSKYVAYGISNDEKMGGDSVLECVKEDKVNPFTVKAYRSWNVPYAKHNKRLDIQDGFSLITAQVIDDIIFCKIAQDSEFEIEGVAFDLQRTPYHLLLAAGSSLKADSVGFHDNVFISSKEKKLLSDIKPSVHYDDFYNDCGILKNCLGFPDQCVTSKNCMAVVSVLAQGSKYLFEVKARSEAYVAVGLSYDSKMGEDSVIECVRDQNNGRVMAFMSWNIAGEKANIRKGVNQVGVNLLNSSYSDGIIYCKFTRDAKTIVEQKSFDLIRDKYHLLLAAGSSLKENSVGFHDLVYTASGEARLLSDVGEFTIASKLLLRLHGAFMVAAWIGAASIGIVLARYFKQTWVGSSLCAKDLWFAWHRFFMLLTWCFTLVGFALIFVEIGEWVESSSSQVHAILGCITTFLCFIQPIGAAFRPHPTARNRPLFNWLHWTIGNSAHIVSIVTIFFALPINKAELPEWLDWVLVAFVAFYVIVHLLLSFSACIGDRNNGKRVNSFPMKDMGSRAPLNSTDRKQDAPHSGFRRVMLFIHIIGILVLAVAIIIIIVLAPIEEQWKKLKSKLMTI